jgi:hypothetical protein
VDLNLRRSVEGCHGVRAYFGVFLAPSYFSLGPQQQWGGWCPGQTLGRLLSKVFTWRLYLISWSDEVDRLTSPLQHPTADSHLPRGQGLPMRNHLVLSQWWSVMFVGGRESSRGFVIGWRFCPLRYLPKKYHIVKWVLTRRCLPPGKVMMLFRRVP